MSWFFRWSSSSGESRDAICEATHKPMQWHLTPDPWDFRRGAATLLITDHPVVWRFRDCFAETGIDLLDPGNAHEVELGPALRSIDSPLIAVALRDTSRYGSTVIHYAKTNGVLGSCLFYIGNGQWLRGSHPQLLAQIENPASSASGSLDNLADIIAFARLVQILKPNLISVDVVDILACLDLSRHDCAIVIGTFHLPRDPAQVADSFSRWMREQGIAAPWNCVFCIETSHVENSMAFFNQCADAVHLELRKDAFVVVGTHLRPSITARCTMALLSSREP